MPHDNFSGPIPGENFTSDTRNYPWHRPPEHSDLNEAIDFCIKHLTKKQAAFGILAALEAGVTIAQATRAFVISGISDGKWTPDFAILLAGPIARIMQTMAKGYGINAELGLDPDAGLPTLSAIKFDPDAIDPSRVKDAVQAVDTDTIQNEAKTKSRRGFASRPSPTNDSTNPVENSEEMI